MKTAVFYKRIISYAIDFSFTLLIAILMVCHLFYSMNDLPAFYIYLILIVCPWVFYFIFWGLILLITNGWTLGSLIVGTKVIHLSGKRLSLGDCLSRSICLGIFVFALANAIYMLTVHTEKTIFDRMCDTLTIDKRNNY